MRKQRYIGIENELISFKGDRKIEFGSHFYNLKKRGKFFEISDKAIRTNTGNGYYVDGTEIEILTPPIPINKGFSSRLTDSLMVGRNHVIENTPFLKHTGYSMHWNITKNGDRSSFGRDIVVPFQLFGLTPLSVASALRDKESEGRFELLGDSLVNEDQINATALLLGAYALAKEKSNFPINLDFDVDKKVRNLVEDGRYSIVNTKLQGRNYETQVQDFVNLFYDWLSPFVYKLGDNKEIGNLEGFIKGEKKLEVDYMKYFFLLNNLKGKVEGIYNPVNILSQKGVISPVLNKNSIRDIPLEGKLLGNLISNKNFKISSLSWDNFTFRDKKDKTVKTIKGIEEIYKFSAKNSSLKYSGTKNLPAIETKCIDSSNEDLEERLGKRREYNIDEDTSGHSCEETNSFKNYFKDFNFNFLKGTFQNCLIFASSIAFTASLSLFLLNKPLANIEAKERIKEYIFNLEESPQENTKKDSLGVTI